MAVLPVAYHDALERPAEVAADLNRFLGGTLDEKAMAAAVDPELRREGRRKAETTK